MRKLGLVIVALALAGLVSSGAWAQSAKFAATWSTDVKSIKAAIVSGGSAGCTGDGTGGGTSGDPCVLAVVELAQIHVPQQKELLIGISAQIGLITLTQAKGKKTEGTATFGEASAEGKVVVTVTLEDVDSGDIIATAPGPVIFAKRLQELKVSSDIDTDVIVSLKLDTTAAHHFNFLGIDLPQGTYKVIATFDLSAFVAIVGDDAIAEAEVILGPRVVSAQEVRAVKDSIMTP